MIILPLNHPQKCANLVTAAGFFTNPDEGQKRSFGLNRNEEKCPQIRLRWKHVGLVSHKLKCR